MNLVAYSSLFAQEMVMYRSVSGVPQGDTLDNVRMAIGIKSKGDDKKVYLIIEKDIQKIKSALAGMGYLNAQVDSRISPISSHQLKLQYHIHLGQILKIRSFTLQSMVPIPWFNVLIRKDFAHMSSIYRVWMQNLQPGKRFVSSVYEDLKKKILDDCARDGYLDAMWHTSVVSVEHDQADITWILHPKKRYDFGPVDFGSLPIDHRVLRTYFAFKEGEPYQERKIKKSIIQLDLSGYFQNVQLLSEKKRWYQISSGSQKSHSHHVPMKLIAGLKPKQHYTVGLGYATDTRWKQEMRLDRRYLNRYGAYWTNFGTWSSVRRMWQSSYVLPYSMKHRYSFTVSAIRDYFNFWTSIYRAEISKITGLSPWTLNTGLAYHTERNQINNHIYSERFKFWVPNLALSYISAIEKDRPKWQHTWSLQGSSPSIGANTRFLQVFGKHRVALPIDRHQWVGRLCYGASQVGRSEKLPTSFFFFLGGMDTLRGFSYRSLGPGLYVFSATAEYQYRFHDLYGGIIGMDFGNVAMSPSRLYPLKHCLVLGIKRDTPVGTLKATIARSMTQHAKIHMQFSMETL